jgi:spermidine synthase
MPQTGDRTIRRVLLALFFLSGACGLVYEVVWMRMLTLVVGATAFATAAILSAFFAGLALGSFYFGRRVDRSRNPLALYAALEAGVGVFAFLMPVLLAGVTALYVAVQRRMDLGFYPLSLLRLVLSIPVLVLPATLMGGTLPVIVKFFVRSKDGLGLDVGRLYAVNTFGAVLGAFGAGFFLILFLGVREAAYLAGVVNLGLAGLVYALSRGVSLEPGGAAPEEPATAAEAKAQGLSLWAVGLSGLAALALEVLWTRALVYFLDNSTHAFTTMLTAFLLGIAIGGAVVAWFADRGVPLVAVFGVVEVLIGISSLLAVPVLAGATPVLYGLEGQKLDAWFLWKWTALRFARSLTVMLVPTILMGMTVPLVAKICTLRLNRVGDSLGRVYSTNTIGGVVGSLIAGFLLIPLIGLRDGILVVAALSTLIGIVLLAAQPVLRGWLAPKAGIIAGAVLIFAAASRLATDQLVLASYRERADAAEVLSYQEGIGSTVKVFRDKRGAKVLSIDGFPVAGTSRGLLDAQESMGNVPMLLSDAASPRVNLIGFGAGGASWEVLQYDVTGVDCVELVPAVIDAAKWFPEVNHGVLSQSRYRLIMGDGRNYALVTDRQYDVISVDATSPKMAGNGSLYTREFYRLLERRLSEHGLALQWLPFHLLSDGEVRMTVRTFMEVFPHTTLWLSPLRYHGLLVGTRTPLRIDVPALRHKMERPGVREELARVGVTAPLDFLAGFVMGEEDLRRYAAGARVNTDDHPYLEFTPAWSYFLALEYGVHGLDSFRQVRTSVAPLLTHASAAFADSMERRYQATQHSIRGDIFYSLGRREEALREWTAALSIDPSDGSATRGLRRISGQP